MIVWVIETGEYEYRHIVGVASSVDVAVKLVKGMHGSPYIVSWKQDSMTSMVGYFEEVIGFSTKHSEEYTFTPYEVLFR